MTQKEFWTIIGPHFFIVVGIFMLYTSYGYTEKTHEEMDWENQNWAGFLSKEILSIVPYWVVRAFFAFMGVSFFGLYFYTFFFVDY